MAVIVVNSTEVEEQTDRDSPAMEREVLEQEIVPYIFSLSFGLCILGLFIVSYLDCESAMRFIFSTVAANNFAVFKLTGIVVVAGRGVSLSPEDGVVFLPFLPFLLIRSWERLTIFTPSSKRFYCIRLVKIAALRTIVSLGREKAIFFKAHKGDCLIIIAIFGRVISVDTLYLSLVDARFAKRRLLVVFWRAIFFIIAPNFFFGDYRQKLLKNFS